MDILSKIGFDWHVAIANLVNFLLIFYILKRFLFKPIARTLLERKKKIEEGLAHSALAEEAVRSANAERERILNETRQEANILISTAEKNATLLKEKRIAEAESEAEKLVENAKIAMAQERVRIEAELAVHTAELAVRGAEKILKERVDASHNSLLIKHTTQHVSSNTL